MGRTFCPRWASLPLKPGPLCMLGTNEESCPHSFMQQVRQFHTGYAITFNRRHYRQGHILHNHYRSILEMELFSDEIFISIKGQQFKILPQSLNIFNPSLFTFLQSKPNNPPHPFITTQCLSRNRIALFDSIVAHSPTLLEWTPGFARSSLQPLVHPVGITGQLPARRAYAPERKMSVLTTPGK